MKKASVPLLLAVAVILSLIPQFRHEAELSHQAPWWESVPGFFGLFGFIGGLLLVGFSLGLGKALLRKDEKYYDDK